ncbi:MAG: P-II family nitrogen regulator [Nitrospinales bacterium]
MVKCYIRHEKLETVREKLFELGVPGLSVTDVRGIGKPMSQLKSVPGSKVPHFHPRVEISIVLEDLAVDEVVDMLVATVQTGKMGDGKIFVLPVDEAVRIRTGEKGEDALY